MIDSMAHVDHDDYGIYCRLMTPRRIFFNFHQGFEEIRLVLVGRVYDSRSHRHKMIDHGGVGRVQIAGDDIGQSEVVEYVVLLDEPVPLVRATVDGQSELG